MVLIPYLYFYGMGMFRRIRHSLEHIATRRISVAPCRRSLLYSRWCHLRPQAPNLWRALSIFRLTRSISFIRYGRQYLSFYFYVPIRSLKDLDKEKTNKIHSNKRNKEAPDIRCFFWGILLLCRKLSLFSFRKNF